MTSVRRTSCGEDVLLHHLHTKLGGLDHFRDIPRDKIFCLFIDAKRWSEALREVPGRGSPLGAKIFDQKEPGYMRAMMRAFIWALDQSSRVIDEKFIEELHAHAVEGVTDSHDEALRPGFRKSIYEGNRESECFQVVLGENITEQGCLELYNKRKNNVYTVVFDSTNEHATSNLFEMLVKDPWMTTGIQSELRSASATLRRTPGSVILQASPTGIPPSPVPFISSARFLEPSRSLSLPSFGGGAGAARQPNEDEMRSPPHINIGPARSPELPEFSRREQRPPLAPLQIGLSVPPVPIPTPSPSSDTLVSPHYLTAVPKIVVNPPRTGTILPKSIAHLLGLCFRGDSLGSVADRLLLMQNLDQIHPFYDGNVRVFVILLSLIFAARSGETPPCYSDPNCFDACDIDILTAKHEEAIRNFFLLIRNGVDSIPEN